MECMSEEIPEAGCCDDLPLIDVGSDTVELDAPSDAGMDSPEADALPPLDVSVDSAPPDAPVDTGKDSG
jgi:hypothetical protein